MKYEKHDSKKALKVVPEKFLEKLCPFALLVGMLGVL